jgi:RNA polymerase sigma factor (sigma-70 family)
VKDLRIVARIYNNQLRERREALGMTSTAFAAHIGVSLPSYIHLETMNHSPLTSSVGPFGKAREPRWRASALRIAEFYNLPPEDLFPDAVVKMRKTIAEVRVDAEEVALMLSPPIDSSPLMLLAAAEDEAALSDAMGVLNHYEKEVITKRFGLEDGQERTFAEIGEDCQLSRERIRQIQNRALDKIRGELKRAKHSQDEQ